MTDRLPPPETLRQLLSYDPETGLMYWKERTSEFLKRGTASAHKRETITAHWNNMFAGKLALNCLQGSGYKTGAVLRIPCVAHRVAYSIYHGINLAGEIDHINGDKSDNRIANLRMVAHSENSRNVSLYSNNNSGFHGVLWDHRRRKWEARIGVNGRQTRIGRYNHKEDAIAARKAAEVVHGYHENHGRQARLAR